MRSVIQYGLSGCSVGITDGCYSEVYHSVGLRWHDIRTKFDEDNYLIV
jgi:hypothetical protein